MSEKSSIFARLFGERQMSKIAENIKYQNNYGKERKL